MPFKFSVFILLFFWTTILFGQNSSLPLLLNSDFKDANHLNKTALKKLSFKNSIGIFSIADSLSNTQVGAVDSKGRMIIPPRYINIFAVGKISVLVKPSGTFEFYHTEHGVLQADLCDTFKIEDSKILYRSDFKWGAYVFTTKSFKIIDPKYKELSFVGNELNGLVFDQWKFISSNNEACCVYADSFVLNKRLTFFSRGGKFGLVDITKGKELTTAFIKEIKFISNDHIIAKGENGLGLINNEGKELIPFVLDSLSEVKDNLYKGFKLREGWRFYSKENNYLPSKTYDLISEYGDGLIPVKTKDGLWAYVNQFNKVVINPKFIMAAPFKGGFAEVQTDSSKLFIDTHGKKVADSSNYSWVAAGLYFRDSLGNVNFPMLNLKYDSLGFISEGRVLVKLNDKYGVIDSMGKEIIPVDYTSILPLKEEKIFFVYKKEKFGIIDFNGVVLSEPHIRFQKVFDFKEGRAKFLKAGKFGFIDKRGNVRVAPQYKEARDFNEGLAAVFLNEKWGFIDKDEEIKVQPLYKGVSDFRNGLAIVNTGKQVQFVRRDGSVVSKITYDSIREEGKDNWLLFKNSKIGLADSSGREILAPRYEDLINHGEVILVKKYNKWGAVDKKENVLQPIEFDFINYSNIYNVFIIKSNGKNEKLVINDAK